LKDAEVGLEEMDHNAVSILLLCMLASLPAATPINKNRVEKLLGIYKERA
jgi:hypothetical protein